MQNVAPRILAVDDKREVNLGLGEKVVLPEELTQELVNSADLILVDYTLDAWKDNAARQPEHVATAPLDGLALSMMIRRATTLVPGNKPIGVAVLTGKIGDLAYPLPHSNRNHVLAGLNNLEWVFDKGDAHLVDQVLCLGRVIANLPRTWPDDNIQAVEVLSGLLGLRSDDTAAIAAALDYGAPLAELSRWSHGLFVVRWLFQRVLPYPSFLVNDVYLAAAVGAGPASLRQAINQGGELAQWLGRAEYRGIGNDFSTRRWWKPIIDQMFRELSIDNIPGDRFAYLVAMDARLQAAPRDLFAVIVDAALEPTDDLVPLDQSVKLFPDDWPRKCELPRTTPKRIEESTFLKSLTLAKAYDLSERG